MFLGRPVGNVAVFSENFAALPYVPRQFSLERILRKEEDPTQLVPLTDGAALLAQCRANNTEFYLNDVLPLLEADPVLRARERATIAARHSHKTYGYEPGHLESMQGVIAAMLDSGWK